MEKNIFTRICYFLLAVSLFIGSPAAMMSYNVSAANRQLISTYTCNLNADGWLGITLNFKNAGDLEGWAKQNAIVGGHSLEPATLNFYSDNTFEFISPLSKDDGEIQLPAYTVTGNYINISGKNRFEDSLFYYGETFSPTVLDTGLHIEQVKKDGKDETESYTEKIAIKSVNIYAAREVEDFSVNLPGTDDFKEIKSIDDIDSIMRWDMKGGWLLVDIKGGITRRYSRNAGMTDLTDENIYIHMMYDVEGIQAGSMGIGWMYDLFGFKENIVYNNDAKPSPGVDSGTSIPNRIVNGGKLGIIAITALGAGGAAAAAAGAAAGGTSGNSNDPDSDDKTYNMYIYKDFGDTIPFIRDPPPEIYAYITETDKHGTARINGQLSGSITASSDVHTITLYDAGVMPDGRKKFLIRIENDNIAETVVLSFRFTGAGGTVTNNVKFKVQGDPIVTFVSKNDFGNVYGVRESDGVMLLGEDDTYFRTRDIYMRLIFFTEKPYVPTSSFSDGNVNASFEFVGNEKYPYVYKMKLENITKPCDFPVGDFPFKDSLSFEFANGKGERADGKYTINFFPKGIFFIPADPYSSSNIKKDHICLPTNEFVAENGTSADLKAIEYAAYAVYMNPSKIKDTDKDAIFEPPEIVKYPYPADEKCREILDTQNRKFAYELIYKTNMTVPTQNQIIASGSSASTPVNNGKGEFLFRPLNTVVTQNSGEKFMCFVEFAFRKNGQDLNCKLMCGITGERIDLYAQSRDIEVKKILRTIRLLQLDTIEEVRDHSNQVFMPADQIMGRLIYFDKVNQLGSKLRSDSLELSRMLRTPEKYSTVHLRFMRRALLEDANKYWRERAGIDREYCDIMECNIIMVRSVRWMVDMAFTICWYLLLKDKAVYTEPIASALKDTFLEWIGTTTQWAIGSGDYVDFWTKDRFFDTAYTIIESELLTAVTIKPTPKKIGIIAGGLIVFIIAKNFHKNYNSQTGQFDIWKILQGTLKDITVDTIKALAVGVTARIIRKNIYSDTRLNTELRKVFGKLMKETARKMRAYTLAANIAVNEQTWMQRSVMWLFETTNPERHYTNFMTYATEAFSGTAVDFTASNGYDLTVGNTINFVSSFGTTTLDVDGERMEVPYLAAFCLYVHDQFEKLGLNSVHFDYSGVLPDDMPYENREELAKKLGKIPPDPKNYIRKEEEFIIKGIE